MKKILLTSLILFLAGNLAYSQGISCPTADPFCTGTTYNFPNNTGIADAGTFDCLFTTPNPAWYYLQIATTGPITINIEQTDLGGVMVLMLILLVGAHLQVQLLLVRPICKLPVPWIAVILPQLKKHVLFPML
ncbi:MAG: hypothetical protein J0L87_00265 [Bacteroidetes bacterium]|nr:hypothetical protein [Bacteroidota bacterium]